MLRGAIVCIVSACCWIVAVAVAIQEPRRGVSVIYLSTAPSRFLNTILALEGRSFRRMPDDQM
jgi:hypothetical protein